MRAVREILGTIVEETGRTAAGSHSLKRAASRTDVHHPFISDNGHLVGHYPLRKLPPYIAEAIISNAD